MSKNLRVNERIRVPEVRVIDENGEQAGVMKTRDALAIARNLNLDLVEVAPNAQPPVCRLLDYGKYRYEQGKKEKEARKSQKVIVIKEVRLRPKIDDHDLETKGKQARSFLEEGHKVKMTVLFRGREMAHQEIGREVLNQMIDMLRDVALIEQTPRVEGRNMTMLLSKSVAKASSNEPKPARPPSAATEPKPVVASPISAEPKSARPTPTEPKLAQRPVAPAPAEPKPTSASETSDNDDAKP